MIKMYNYTSGLLAVEGVRLDQIAAEVGTPCYVYSTARLKHNYAEFAAVFKGLNTTIYYANKANPNQAVTHTLIGCGAGVDITSVGELERALHAGASPDRIIYSGVGKTRDEIETTLIKGIHQINVESVPELKVINEVAGLVNKRAPITLRINPNIAARTYKKTSTAELGTKFGIDLVQLDEVMGIIKTLPHIDFKGFQVHIGSHVYDYEPYREAYTKMAELTRIWRAKGFTVERLDLGGGITIPYDGQKAASFDDYAAIVRETVGSLDCELAFEPGRRLVGDAGLLLARVIYDKQGQSKRFLILDAGMNDLIRPAMYGARHSIIPVRENGDLTAPLADVVGPVCETSDLFGEDYRLPGVGQGDLVAILQAGAYGCSMSSNYNGRPLIPEVLVHGEQFAVVRRRIAVSEQIAWESRPNWLDVKKPAGAAKIHRAATS
jgi:diaminopimelate decarboxylase